MDRIKKMQLYAEAGIDWHLLVEPDLRDYQSVGLQLFRRHHDHYVLHAAARHGETLVSTEPFPVELRTEDLLQP